MIPAQNSFFEILHTVNFCFDLMMMIMVVVVVVAAITISNKMSL
jgi:ABC-type lipoprotein release transport system permease subunit